MVAFISGLARTNDPWNDIVDFFRNLANTGVKYALIEQVLEKGTAPEGIGEAPRGGEAHR